VAARAARVLTADLVTEISGDELPALIDELRKIADGAPRLAVERVLADKLETLTEPLDPTGEERYALLRATTHLTN